MLQTEVHCLLLGAHPPHQQHQPHRLFARGSTPNDMACSRAWIDDFEHGIDFGDLEGNCISDADIYEPIPINVKTMDIVPEYDGHRNLFLSTFEPSINNVGADNKVQANRNTLSITSNPTGDIQFSFLEANVHAMERDFDMTRKDSDSRYQLVSPPAGKNGGKLEMPSLPTSMMLLSPHQGLQRSCSDASRSELSISSRSSNSQQRSTETFDDRWDQKFSQLLHFVKMHGHARVPVRYQSNLSLSKWAKRQRYQYKLKYEGKHSTLSDEREQKLIDIGFEWDIRCTVWEERFDELVEFKRLNGHMSVPIGCLDFPKLGSWVKCARRQGKLYARGEPSSMTADRAAKLQAIGFKWDARSCP